MSHVNVLIPILYGRASFSYSAFDLKDKINCSDMKINHTNPYEVPFESWKCLLLFSFILRNLRNANEWSWAISYPYPTILKALNIANIGTFNPPGKHRSVHQNLWNITIFYYSYIWTGVYLQLSDFHIWDHWVIVLWICKKTQKMQ